MIDFDVSLFLTLIVIALPGILIVTPRSVQSLEERVRLSIEQKGKRLPHRATITFVAIMQSLVVLTFFAAIGSITAAKVGFNAPVLQTFLIGNNVLPELQTLLVPTIVISSIGAFIFIGLYYRYFRPRLDTETIQATEKLRHDLGFWGRVLYGGIYEEIFARWGLMSLFTWFGLRLVGEVNGYVVGIAVILSGLLFALLHLPGSLAAGAQATKDFLTATIVLNLLASIIFGWLFWQSGIEAAIIAHIVLHLIWYPFERHYTNIYGKIGK